MTLSIESEMTYTYIFNLALLIYFKIINAKTVIRFEFNVMRLLSMSTDLSIPISDSYGIKYCDNTIFFTWMNTLLKITVTFIYFSVQKVSNFKPHIITKQKPLTI